MEKTIEIHSIVAKPTKAGKDKWEVQTAEENFSIWEYKLKEDLLARIGTSISVDVREAQEGTNYLPTITAMNDASDGTMEPSKPGIKTPDNTHTHETKGYTREQRIAAAVELKAAVEIVKSEKWANEEIGLLGKTLCSLLPEIHGAHKLALSMQE